MPTAWGSRKEKTSARAKDKEWGDRIWGAPAWHAHT